MPELGYPQNDFIKAVKREVGKLPAGHEWLATSALSGIYDRDLKGMLGSGQECIVVRDPSGKRDTIAVAFNYRDKEMTPEKAKGIFYLQRIFSTLFPHNFPHFYFAAGKPEKSKREKDAIAPTGTIRQRIAKLKPGEHGYNADPIIRYPFDRVEEICRQQFHIYIDADVYLENFIIGADGGEYYVDTLWPEEYEGKFTSNVTERIIHYMKTGHYTENEISVVKKSIARFRELWDSSKEER
ncbi:hypothetical protein HY622_04115 [Candidatus Uhrbacteria bacterium]|nr:hypothetical protein [Candidatus Uhrbacteria bacterium]